MAEIVFSGLVMLWRLAGCPTSTSPLSVKATMEGVVRPPSAFSTTCAFAPSRTATQELVVPRSMPIALDMVVSGVSIVMVKHGPVAGPAKDHSVRQSADGRHRSLLARRAHALARRVGYYGS